MHSSWFFSSLDEFMILPSILLKTRRATWSLDSYVKVPAVDKEWSVKVSLKSQNYLKGVRASIDSVLADF